MLSASDRAPEVNRHHGMATGRCPAAPKSRARGRRPAGSLSAATRASASEERRAGRGRRRPAHAPRPRPLPGAGHDEEGPRRAPTSRSPSGCCRTSRAAARRSCAVRGAGQGVLLHEAPGRGRRRRSDASDPGEDEGRRVPDGRRPRGLVSLVQMGILEIHTWNRRRSTSRRPTGGVRPRSRPGRARGRRHRGGAPCANARRGGLESFVKTTGGKGLHVVVPLRRKPGGTRPTAFTERDRGGRSSGATRDSTRLRCQRGARRSKTSSTSLRNRARQTSIAAYSTRAPRRRARVDAALRWDQPAPGLRSDHYTVANSSRRRLAEPSRHRWARYATAVSGTSRRCAAGCACRRRSRRLVSRRTRWRSHRQGSVARSIPGEPLRSRPPKRRDARPIMNCAVTISRHERRASTRHGVDDDMAANGQGLQQNGDATEPHGAERGATRSMPSSTKSS